MQDPNAEREAQRYENPIASRELILETLEKAKKPLSISTLAKKLSIPIEQLEALQRRLFAMQREGQITKTDNDCFAPQDTSNLIQGRVSAHRDGYGFLIIDSQDSDLYLSHKEMRKVFDGDTVFASLITNSKREEASIVQVITRSTEQVVGKLLIEGKRSRVIPENPKIQHVIYIDQNFDVAAEHEQIVLVDITRQPNAYQSPKGVIRQVLGNLFDPGMEVDIAVHNFDIPHVWPEDVLEQIKSFSDEPNDADKTNRFDCRKLPLVTIDGDDAKDFDDAVYCEKNTDGSWQLWVAIADVSHYVELNSALDKEAYNRATSVYFPGQVIPMLPAELSNGLCSLKPQVDRLCMVCEMNISSDGALGDYHFYEAVMHSHARLTYAEVGQMLLEKDDVDSLIRKQHQSLLPAIDELHNLYHVLNQKRQQRGAISFETQETKFVFNAERKIDSIVPITRNNAHKLIEECMLCANVASAQFLQQYKIPALFRSHEGPSEKKLANLQQFLGERGLSLGSQEPTPLDYLALSKQLEGREDASIIQTMMLRSMSQAVYEPDNKGHFGLAYKAYTHFTSPIRRYPDLLVHRAIRSIIRSDANNQNVKRHQSQQPLKKSAIYPYDTEALLVIGEQCSMAERRADDATRDVSNWLKCEYLQQHLGSSFNGIISAVAPFGFFVELQDLFVEGMVHVSQLGQDFYHFDAASQRLVGERTRQIFSLGMSVEVQVERIELDDRKIHLKLVNTSEPKHSKSNKRKPSKRPASKKAAKSSKRPAKKAPRKPSKRRRS